MKIKSTFQRKQNVMKKLLAAFQKYCEILVCDLDNVSTNQIHKVRDFLENNDSLMLVAKNSIIRKAIELSMDPTNTKSDNEKELTRGLTAKKDLKVLLEHLKGNIALVFTNRTYVELKEPIESVIVMQAVKSGVFAPCDVVIPEGPTGQQPQEIEKFQNLGIQVKTVRGNLDVVKPVKIITEGDFVLESHAQICKILSIIPFSYSIKLRFVYTNGLMINRDIIKLSQEQIIESFQNGVKNLTAISLEAGIPNALSIPHLLSNTFKNLIALGIESDYKFKEVEQALNQKSTTVNTGGNKKAENKVEEEEVKEESEEAMDLDDMFG